MSIIHQLTYMNSKCHHLNYNKCYFSHIKLIRFQKLISTEHIGFEKRILSCTDISRCNKGNILTLKQNDIFHRKDEADDSL